jgi:uncharacterized membrane protein YdjX (TVP38/TMEM64 family)/rhodanese-related sulfurtransferase
VPAGERAVTRGLARVAGLLVLGAGAAWAIMHRDLINTGAVEAWLRSFGVWAPAGFVLIYAAGTVLFFSGALLSLAGGALFGPVWGTVWNLLGAILGATLAFLIARSLGADWVAQRLGGRLRRLVDGVAEEGWRFVALTRLVPLVPFNLLNYALGLTRISPRAYVLASAVCMLPGAIAYTWLGYAGRSAAAGDSSALRYALPGLGVLAMIAFIPRLFRRFRTGEPAWIECGELQRRLASGSVTLVDVRQPEEFSARPGHLPGALNVPLADVGRRSADHLAARDLPIVIVCKADRRSAKAAAALIAAGLSDVSVLRGGTEAWHRQGLPLE